MAIYCKAYQLGHLRRFPFGVEKAENARKEVKVENGNEVEIARELRDEDFLYLHEDYTVTDGIFNLIYS